MVILKLKKNKFDSYFLGYVDIEEVLVSKKIYFFEKNYKYFIGYLYDNHKVKLLHIMIPKTNTYVKSYDGQSKWMYFYYWRWWLIRKI